MIIVKDITSILKLDRITSENKAKSALIRSVSHELRTPVNGIMLLVDSLLQDINESCKERLYNLKTCAELLKFQISDILDYSDLDSNMFHLNKSNCNLKTCLEETIRLFKLQANLKGLEIRISIDSMIPDKYFTDIHRLQKIIVNLLSNAVKYTNKGYIEFCAMNIGNSINISIKDTGIGIRTERLARVFNIFSDKGNGMSGLGLHISSSILQFFGAKLQVYSKENQGSTFSFCLDVPEKIIDYEFSNTDLDIPNEIINVPEIPKIRVNLFEKHNPKVLIVDDNDFNRVLLGNALKNNGISFIEAANGKIAVNIIKKFDRQKNPIQCIIMDCDMPVMDGWEASRLINEKYAKKAIKFLPTIIAHTAYTSAADIKKCYDSGMTSHLAKPTNQTDILSILRQYI